MKNSSLANTQEQLNATNSSFNNPASLKGKLQSLEVCITLFRRKSKPSRQNSTPTRNKFRFFAVRRTPLSQYSP